MQADIEIVIEAYRVMKEYVTSKDRQTAADHFVNSIAEYDVSDNDFRNLAQTDKYLKNAVVEYTGEEVDGVGSEEFDVDD